VAGVEELPYIIIGEPCRLIIQSLMQEDTPIEVPMAVRIAINSWMPYFKSSRLFFIVVKV
jgi:hypothetical protein